MAVFRKFLSATKNKMKTPHIKIERTGGKGSGSGAARAGTSSQDPPSMAEEDEEFSNRKQQWQEELDHMSEFLVMKSTEEQREEGVETPVDTAFVEDKDGMPILKAVFDIHHFTPDEIQLSVENEQLLLEGRTTDDRPDAVFRKTMVRKIDLPKYVDPKMMHCTLSKDGRILSIEMPFHLPPQRRPTGPNVVPITEGPDGTRKIRLAFMIGPEFTSDDITLETNGKSLFIKAAYNESVGLYASEVSARELKREYKLPEWAEVDTVKHVFSPDGRLFVEILLKKDKAYKCEVSTEELDIAT